LQLTNNKLHFSVVQPCISKVLKKLTVDLSSRGTDTVMASYFCYEMTPLTAALFKHSPMRKSNEAELG